MKNSIETCDRKCDCQQPDSPGDRRITPATHVVGKRIEHEFCRASPSANTKSNDGNDEKDRVAYASDHFQRVKHLAEVEVPHNRYQDKPPHDQRPMPSFRFVSIVVKDDKPLDDVCEVRWRCCGACNPSEDGDPA